MGKHSRLVRLEERRETRDRVQPVLDLIEHVFGQLDTRNGRLAFLTAAKRKCNELLGKTLSPQEAKRRGIDVPVVSESH